MHDDLTQDLPAAVQHAFASAGALQRQLPGLRVRTGQQTMAQAVAQCLQQRSVLVVEAGTGVGKTYAYLVPALLSGLRVVVSTATKTLQDQLFERDIPRLATALGVSVRVAVLKGRGSYLCIQRMQWAAQREGWGAQARTLLQRVQAWAQATDSGDLGELGDLQEWRDVSEAITSTRDNCLGAACAHAQGCHVNRARRKALQADLVVANHHLFFADLQVRESGVAELLPTVHAVVFDEAHQLNDVGVQFLGRNLSLGAVDRFAQALRACAAQLALGLAQPQAHVQRLLEALATLRALCMGQGGRMPWVQQVPEGVDSPMWSDAQAALAQTLHVLAQGLAALRDMSPPLAQLHAKALELCAELDVFATPCPAGSVRWVQTDGAVRWVQSPLSVAQTLAAYMGVAADAAQAQGTGKAWVFTSATLGHDDALSNFVQTCGLQGAHGARTLRVPSPFDYARQAGLYVPQPFAAVASPEHAAQVAALAARVARALGGRTLVLTTTLRAMRAIGADLEQAFAHEPDMQVLVQGLSSKQHMLQSLVACGQGDRAQGCVLVASASFWEGIDVPGDALQAVILDKLPFAPPDDPLVQARAHEVQSRGGKPFTELHVPQAIIALKQGAGRLIRSETDRGVLIVCDDRLLTKGYGKTMLAALPPMRRIASEAELDQALLDLTKASTMGPAHA